MTKKARVRASFGNYSIDIQIRFKARNGLMRDEVWQVARRMALEVQRDLPLLPYVKLDEADAKVDI